MAGITGERRPVCIAGMHRSGTSMVARLLNLCGLDLGPEADLLSPQPDNPEGYWENANFVRLNDAILDRLGGSWDVPPPLPDGWESQPAVAELRAEAEGLVARFGDVGLWGWKDPRNSLTLRFWQGVLPAMSVVVCVRHPLEVAHSLARRGYSSERFAVGLWLQYHGRLQADAPAAHRIVTHYDAYFLDPEAELTRVLGLLGLPAPVATVTRACAAVSALLHTITVLPGDLARLPSDVRELYASLCREAGAVHARVARGELLGPASPRPRTVSGHAEPPPEQRSLFELRLEQLAAVLHETEEARAALAIRLAERDEAARALQLELAERAEAARTLEEAGRALETALATAREEAARQAETIGALQARVAETEGELGRITGSTGWALLVRLWRLRTWAVPEASRRERSLRAALGWLRARPPATAAAVAARLCVGMDLPLPDAVVAGRDSRLYLAGWCYHTTRDLVGLDILAGDVTHRVRARRLVRRDIFAHRHPEHDPNGRSLRSGFQASLPLPAVKVPTHLPLRLRAHLDDGSMWGEYLGTLVLEPADHPPEVETLAPPTD